MTKLTKAADNIWTFLFAEPVSTTPRWSARKALDYHRWMQRHQSQFRPSVEYDAAPLMVEVAVNLYDAEHGLLR